MANNIQKKTQSTRTQSRLDKKTVFGFQDGSIQADVRDPEVELSKELYTEYNSSRQQWAQSYQEAIEFRAGAQWTLEEQEVLESRGQAPIVVNRIHPIVETAKSLLTYNSPQFRASAREDSDRGTAKVFSDLFQYIWQTSVGDEELKQTIDDYYVGGMGCFLIYQDPMKDLGKGEVCLKSIDPLDVYIDPNSKDTYGRDAAHILIVKTLTDEQAERIYPDYMDIIYDSELEVDTRDNRPSTDLAATEGQQFYGDDENRYHDKRRYTERYTKTLMIYQNVYEPFSNKEYLFTPSEYNQYLSKQYIKIRKITGEEIIVFESEAIVELLGLIEKQGPVFHFELPEPEYDDMTGELIPQEPVRVAGDEDENSIPGSTTIIIPISVEELVGLGDITSNQIEKTCVNMVSSVGDKLLYTRMLPCEDYPIVPLMNVHHRNPYPESDVRLFRPLQEYINKIRSLIIAHASTSTNVKLLIPRGSADLRQIEEEWSKAGTSVIEFDAELGAPIVAGPVPLPNELYKNEADAKYDLEYGFGIFELMQGGSQNAPSTARGTMVVDEFGQRRIKSRRDDIENFLNQCAKVAIPLIQQLYTEEKLLRIIQPNGLEKESIINYQEVSDNTVKSIHDVGVGRYDIVVVSGSTLPTNKMAMLETYVEMFKLGLIDQEEVLKKTEVVDIEGVMSRHGEMQQMLQEIQSLQEELKQVKGDLQTASREEIHAKKRLEIEKFSTDLDKVSNRADMATSLYKARLQDAKSNLINSAEEEQSSNIFKDVASDMES
tara:strand:+ start:9331 stop:11646 length:2316 start_codon:yes stop_codon:yes gene_type:complete